MSDLSINISCLRKANFSEVVDFTGKINVRLPVLGEYYVEIGTNRAYRANQPLYTQKECILEFNPPPNPTKPDMFSYGWVAMDGNGEWHWYNIEPTFEEEFNGHGEWLCDEEVECITLDKHSEWEDCVTWKPPTVEPKDSLIFIGNKP